MPMAARPAPKPGQFFMIGLPESKDPLLKRPFSLFGAKDGLIQILFKVRGKGTYLISRLPKGAEVSALGPLGRHYPPPPKGFNPLVIAGGIGMASLFSLIQSIRPHVIYGARSEGETLMLDEIKEFSSGLSVATEDGSLGTKGTALDILREFLSEKDKNRIIYACGPKGMLRAASEAVLGMGLKGYVSLEENMACGYGVCLGCAVMTNDGYKRVCKEGPVFSMDEITWQT